MSPQQTFVEFGPVHCRTTKYVLAAGLIIFVLIFTKTALAHGLAPSILLPGLISGYTLLCVISPPVAAAFFIASAQLLTQVSMAHPGISAFGTMALVLLATSLAIRWREGLLAEFSRFRWTQFLPWILLAIAFAIGFFRAVQAPYAVVLDFSSVHSLLSVLHESQKGTQNSLHFVFLSHWLVFIALGILACTRLAELKIFLIAFSLLHVVSIFPLPVDFYPHFFEEIYYRCQPMGLHNMRGDISEGSVNRSQVGYLAAIGSLVSLSFAHHQDGPSRRIFYFCSVFAAVILFLAGSKGPVLGWVIGIFVVMGLADNKARIRSLVLACVIALAMGISTFLGYSPIPCGTVRQYVESYHESVDVRTGLAEEAMGVAIQRPSAKAAPLLHMLLGSGFGASSMMIDPDTRQMLVHAGSHNLLIDLFVDTGLAGLALFLLALTILIKDFFRPLLIEDFPDRMLLIAAMGGTFIVVLVMLLLTTSTYREYFGAFLIGILMGSPVYMTRRSSPPSFAASPASTATGRSQVSGQ